MKSGRVRRVVRATRRSLLVLAAVMVLLVAGFAWTEITLLDRALPDANVLASADDTRDQNILLLGVDSRTDVSGHALPPRMLAALHAGDSTEGGDTADSITVVHVPAGGGKASAFSVPRDTYIPMPDGSGSHKINSAYTRGEAAAVAALTTPRPGTPAPPSANDPAVQRAGLAGGARATIEAVQGLTGLPITHFGLVNLAGFADVSQALGGVPVCLKDPVDDSYSGLRLPAGPNLVAGPQALAFVRQRHGLPNGDLDRITRQQTFLAAATGKVLSAGTLTSPSALSALRGAVSRSVVLDSGWNVLGFTQHLQGLSAGAVTFRTVPIEQLSAESPDDGAVVTVDPQDVRAFVTDSIRGDVGAVGPPPPHPAVAPVAAAPPPPRAAPAPPGPPAPPPRITAAAPGCIE